MKTIVKSLSFVILAGGLAGCNGVNESQDKYDNDTRPIGYYSNEEDNRGDLDRGIGFISDMADRDTKDHTSTYHEDYDGALAERIAEKVNNIRGVDDAHVILEDNNVIVGIDTDGKKKEELTDKIRETTAKMVPDREVKVVSDQRMVDRIQNVDNDLRDGRAYTEVETDVRGIMNDIVDAGSDLGNAIKRPFENNR
ncbi:YhcN/YlaJ family sporulation lipoprotein [Fictibacillus nanhaiensis]|uniref:YhcN/YlaJ family sporulation lipoprotein n=1 Tax=Fictibacillus nanhaiensis TaxID=742169 RepID=UPI001C97292B|nr:YhcN/YlaJ family sporulation lipoprotein [Fictibacillus nanhaiensis]MBY6035335.1 YhcN/YlaJ family sporulation lipoprotein [Fictibacillus nanhaiensis]